MDYIYSVDDRGLTHWGIVGMKWGVRRYQNPDGSLTPAGRKRYTNADGSLNEKGKKLYNKEKARIRAERQQLLATQKTNEQLLKLGQLREQNEALKKGPSPVREIVDYKEPSSKNSGSDKNKQADSDDRKKLFDKPVNAMTNTELNEIVNRLRNESSYKDLTKQLGYDPGGSEIDRKIEELKKQKNLLELERDIKTLTPKKVSKGKAVAKKMWDKMLEPALEQAGKKLFTDLLTDAGAKAVGKIAGKEKDAIVKSANKQKQKQQTKTKPAAQPQTNDKTDKEKSTKQPDNTKAEKQERKEAPVFTESKSKSQDASYNTRTYYDTYGTSNTSSSSSGNTSRAYNSSESLSMILRNYDTRPMASLPSSTVIYASSPKLAGYLPAPKDDDD